MSWKTDKDLGPKPWNFSSIFDKWAYLNNKRWTLKQNAITFSEDLGLPIDKEDQHIPCGHWHKKTPGYFQETVIDECSYEKSEYWVELSDVPGHICSDGEYIYVMNDVFGSERVYKYQLDGTPVTNFPVTRRGGLDVDDSWLYVAGGFMDRYTKAGVWNLLINTISGSMVVKTFNGYLYVPSYYGLYKLDQAGNIIWSNLTARGTGVGQYWGSESLCVTSDYVYVSDYSNYKVILYRESDGVYVSEHSFMVPIPPLGIRTDGDYIYVANGATICVFELDMTYICCIPVFTSEGMNAPYYGNLEYDNGHFYSPVRIGGVDPPHYVIDYDLYVAGDVEEIEIDNEETILNEPQVWTI